MQYSLSTSQIMVETDSYTLVQMVRGLAAVPWKMQYLLERIKLLFKFLNLQIKHIYREANGLADFLASFAVKSEQSTEFSANNILPSIGRVIMQQDLYGFPSTRLKRLICEQREESRAVLQYLLVAPFPFCLGYLLDFFCELLSVDDQKSWLLMISACMGAVSGLALVEGYGQPLTAWHSVANECFIADLDF
ncbi:unnamed protein product [Ilex paraguariensis]|uniref:RNase H type-1 domain-containing protein n=1 Tax=Ilex paraguariensis TaxID=185542 RepID=A0ABC8RZX5_9AQUA